MTYYPKFIQPNSKLQYNFWTLNTLKMKLAWLQLKPLMKGWLLQHYETKFTQPAFSQWVLKTAGLVHTCRLYLKINTYFSQFKVQS